MVGVGRRRCSELRGVSGTSEKLSAPVELVCILCLLCVSTTAVVVRFACVGKAGWRLRRGGIGGVLFGCRCF